MEWYWSAAGGLGTTALEHKTVCGSYIVYFALNANSIILLLQLFKAVTFEVEPENKVRFFLTVRNIKAC